MEAPANFLSLHTTHQEMIFTTVSILFGIVSHDRDDPRSRAIAEQINIFEIDEARYQRRRQRALRRIRTNRRELAREHEQDAGIHTELMEEVKYRQHQLRHDQVRLRVMMTRMELLEVEVERRREAYLAAIVVPPPGRRRQAQALLRDELTRQEVECRDALAVARDRIANLEVVTKQLRESMDFIVPMDDGWISC